MEIEGFCPERKENYKVKVCVCLPRSPDSQIGSCTLSNRQRFGVTFSKAVIEENITPPQMSHRTKRSTREKKSIHLESERALLPLSVSLYLSVFLSHCLSVCLSVVLSLSLFLSPQIIVYPCS